jgi:CBS domain-containing protein
MVSLLLFGLFLIIGVNVPLPVPIAAIVSLLASMNLALALFNLIPGLPLDGGNVLKALVWKITGNPNRGIIFASRVGQLFGWLAILVGGLAILGVSPIGNFWTLLIGWFLLQNAGNSAQSAQVQETLNGLTAEEAVIPDSPIVNANLNLREFANEYVIGQARWSKFLVTDDAGQLQGALATDDLKKVATSDWTKILVRELIQPNQALTTVRSKQTLLEVVKLLEERNIPQLAVVNENGSVVGLLEKASVINLLQRKAQLKAA